MATPSASALSAYRQILRATRIAFKGWSDSDISSFCLSFVLCKALDSVTDNKKKTVEDDFKILLAARSEARQQFEQHRRTAVDTPMQIQHALETASILRHNIVQGSRDAEKADGKWGTLSPEYICGVLIFFSFQMER